MEGKRLSYKGSKSILSHQIPRQIETERVRERSCMLINITQFRAFCSLLTQTLFPQPEEVIFFKLRFKKRRPSPIS